MQGWKLQADGSDLSPRAVLTQLAAPSPPLSSTQPPPQSQCQGNHTSRKSSPSLGKTLPCRQRLRNHLSFMKSRRKLCLNCWDSCTNMFFSWLQNFCSSLRCRLRLWSSNSRRRSALCWSSFSCKRDQSMSHPSCLGDPRFIPFQASDKGRNCMWCLVVTLLGILSLAVHTPGEGNS